MNDLDSVERRPKNTNTYQYGLSSLHAWIRCMECLIHIAYRMEIKKWSCRGEEKQKLNEKKKQIQEDFKSECGLLIDVVKQGAGNKDWFPTKHSTICSMHFKEDDYVSMKKRRLFEKAYPTIQIVKTTSSEEEINQPSRTLEKPSLLNSPKKTKLNKIIKNQKLKIKRLQEQNRHFGGCLDNDQICEAKEALVFLVTGVNANSKVPVGYFLIDGATGQQKANLVLQCLKHLNDTNVSVIGLTFDGCPSNFYGKNIGL
ncbi:hypothetical protein evm_008514 [Chilo suppressalis]|nr:hypothetical protein evm_008514 [Chilo suppressalis]